MSSTPRKPYIRKEVLKTGDYEIRVLGVPPATMRDLYHWFLRQPTGVAMLAIVTTYLLLNCIFAWLYLEVGGVQNMQAGSFADAFFFSVQTMGTIGYGGMIPSSRGANVLMVAESIVSLMVTALATGLVFVRFSQTRPRMVFCKLAPIGPMDGIPTLCLRLGNERRDRIVDAQFKLVFTRTTRTAEGTTIYLSKDLELVRSSATSLSRSWMVLHRVIEGSPLFGLTPEQIAADEGELLLAVKGTDETSLQTVFANYSWGASSIVFGAKLTDILSELPDGNMVLDLTKFHSVDPTTPIEGFAYPRSVPAPAAA